jgi:uncharacterized OB-fold protein
VNRPPKPVPVPDPTSEGFWAAACEHRLVVQRCRGCGWLAYPPSTVCRRCLDDPPDFEWAPISGSGNLKTWTVVRDSFLPAFADETPYVIAEVEMIEQAGLRIIARLVDVEVDDLALGIPVEVSFDDRAPGVSVPQFVRAAP